MAAAPTMFNGTMPNGQAPTAAYLAESKVDLYRNGSIIPAALVSIVVLARFYTRLVLLRTWKHDDSLLLVAWLMGWAIVVFNLLLISHRGGRHIELVSYADAVETRKLAYFARLVYQMALTTTKLSLCFCYLHIFTDRRGQMITIGIMAFIIISSIPLIVAPIFECTPHISDAWSLNPDAHCPTSKTAMLLSGSIINIISDVALMCFVIPRILQLQISVKQKGILLLIVSTSIFVVIACIMRIVVTYRIVSSHDPTWHMTDISVWSAIEINTGLFCASVVSIKPLVRKFFPKFLGSHGSTAHSSLPTFRAADSVWTPLHETKAGAHGVADVMAMDDLESRHRPSQSLAWSEAGNEGDASMAQAFRDQTDGESHTSSGHIVKSTVVSVKSV